MDIHAMLKAKGCLVRPERPEERRAVENLVRESFWNVYRPGCTEHYLLHCLRDDPAFVPELNFVLEKEGKVIGQNVFVRAEIRADDGRSIPILTMGPICIAPEYKRQGYGKLLLEKVLRDVKSAGYPSILLWVFDANLPAIRFYRSLGFTASGRKRPSFGSVEEMYTKAL